MTSNVERRRGGHHAHPDATGQGDDHGAALTEDQVRAVRAIIRAEWHSFLARAFNDQTFSTRAGCAPPGYARDAWRALARKIGCKRGRYWVVRAEQLALYEQRDRGSISNAPPATVWNALASVEAARARRAGGRP
jgi:hypothetical protein